MSSKSKSIGGGGRSTSAQQQAASKSSVTTERYSGPLLDLDGVFKTSGEIYEQWKEAVGHHFQQTDPSTRDLWVNGEESAKDAQISKSIKDIKSIEIDPSLRMADVNRSNNKLVIPD
jgi:hypothetical protein